MDQVRCRAGDQGRGQTGSQTGSWRLNQRQKLEAEQEAELVDELWVKLESKQRNDRACEKASSYPHVIRLTVEMNGDSARTNFQASGFLPFGFIFVFFFSSLLLRGSNPISDCAQHKAAAEMW